MKISKMFSLIVVLVFLAMAAGVTWVVAQSDGDKRVEESTEIVQYLPVVLQPRSPQQIERDILIAFYQSTNGDEWRLSYGWLGPDDHCDWRGVDCVDGLVTGLRQKDNKLSGSIPKELSNLSNLEMLSLELNQLSGPIPAELGNLSNLEELHLYENQLSGSIPKELGDLSNLKELRLYENQLSGSIPKELGNLSNLEELRLNSNQLSGSIPKELSNLSNLEGLYLAGNQLSCWETSGVFQWAVGVDHSNWDYPTPGVTICP